MFTKHSIALWCYLFTSCSRNTFNSEAVVKINSTLQQPDYTLPWQTLDVSEARGV